MRTWILPAAAVSFGTGILLADERVGTVAGIALVVAGTLTLAASAFLGRRRRGRSRFILENARLLDQKGERSEASREALAAPEPEDDHRPPPASRLAALLVGFALLGAGWSVVRRAPTDGLQALDGRFMRFRGTIASDPRMHSFGWGVEANLSRLELTSQVVRLSAKAWLQGRARPPPVEPGHAVLGTGVLRALRVGSSGFEDHLVRRGALAILRVTRLRVLGASGNPALRLANTVRRAIRRGAERALPPREAGLFLGLSVGDTDTLHPEVEEDFRATGLGHLLAVSGSNVAMFLVPVLATVAFAGGGLVPRFVAGLIAVIFFALLTRWEPSVLRASVMASLALLGVLTGRPRSTAAVLGAAALLLLVADPGLARSLGFQLSVAATAGIAALASPLALRLGWLPKPVALALAATLGAQVGVTPILLLSFGIVPGVTPLANVVAFPAVPLALSAGLVASATALVWEPLGSALGKVAVFPLAYLASVADRLGRAPVPSLSGGGLFLAGLTAVLGVMAAWRLRRGRRKLGTGVAVIALVALIWSAAARAGPPSSLTVTFLDVGQGDAAVVRTPEGATLVIDAGPEEQLVATKLAAMGVRRIDLAVATHAHADHVEGFPAVFSRFPIGVLLEPGCDHESPSYHRLIEAVRDEDIRVHHARGDEKFTLGELVVEILGPDECSHTGPNDDSVVVRVRYEDATVLFPGDAEHAAQQDLLDDADPIVADVLKVAHHGGDTSLEEFVRRVGAEVAVVSVGPNDYGHPVPEVLATLEEAGARVIRTDVLGDITLSFARGGALVDTQPAGGLPWARFLA
jgi:competence protein ComEC